ncbi:MAG: hypothetical protein LBS51_03635 [Oscillospiraceae bacterium]|nr:hypothetical protein [Oscillospiraceae bacterium]
MYLKKAVKRALPAAAGFILGAAALLAALYVTGGVLLEEIPGFERTPGLDGEAQAQNSYLVEKAYDILEVIKEGDYAALARSVHPEYGVVFSPYAAISLATNKCFTESQVADFATDANTYVWGVYDGSGDPIELTPAEYFARFVYNRDFARASVVGVNYIVRSGNALENITEVFPGVRFVDFYLPGDDKSPDSYDWNSLRLGFEEHSGGLRLTVIVHSEWTI